jgi:hypothetical protein
VPLASRRLHAGHRAARLVAGRDAH